MLQLVYSSAQLVPSTTSGDIKVFLYHVGMLGPRELQYNKDGWANHPRTRVVHSMADADLVVWLSTMTFSDKEIPPETEKPVVLLDYSDGCRIHRGRKKSELAYFKRSWVGRDNGIFRNPCVRDKTVLPFAYSIIDRFVMPENEDRYYNIVCTLRHLSAHNQNRKKIRQWTMDFVAKHHIERTHIGDMGNGFSAEEWTPAKRGHSGSVFHSLNSNAIIIVTSNPNSWEGDFRLWEALASSALVFVDNMEILKHLPYPPIHREHIIYYDPTDQSAFQNLLIEFLANREEARRIGRNGRKLVLEHHRTIDRVDHVLKTIKFI